MFDYIVLFIGIQVLIFNAEIIQGAGDDGSPTGGSGDDGASGSDGQDQIGDDEDYDPSFYEAGPEVMNKGERTGQNVNKLGEKEREAHLISGVKAAIQDGKNVSSRLRELVESKQK
ncbi:unnamed protein product [Cylicocyclus nassatus]|uniref:Uncharacterized protein n=1 Tax=Cylicocyclus nassatus TaxID=53992 RepID=A0AA36GNS1_CYLNA|nr:unnamed protein product [Cylicocyclus nassatus]